MLLSYLHLHVGLTIYHDGESHVVLEHGDIHNVRVTPAGCASLTREHPTPDFLCMLPGCSLYRPVFDTASESLDYMGVGGSQELDASYVEQNGCWNCRHNFCYHEFDEAVGHYCNEADPASRPPCDSVAMGEIPTTQFNYDEAKTPEENEDAHDAEEAAYDAKAVVWRAWAGKHAVGPQGICGKWAHEHPRDAAVGGAQ